MAEPSFLPSHHLCWFYSGPVPTILCATHPADQSDLGGSCLRGRHLAKPILGLRDVKLGCQLFHAAGCQRGGLSVNVRTAWLGRAEMRRWLFLPPESASLSLLVNPSYVNIALWTHRNEDRSDSHKWHDRYVRIHMHKWPRDPPMCSVLHEQVHITVNTDIVSPFTSSWGLSMVSGVHLRACVKRRISLIYSYFLLSTECFSRHTFDRLQVKTCPTAPFSQESCETLQ